MQCWCCSHKVDEGVAILGLQVCPRCEEAIVTSSVEDPNYDKLIQRVKEMWSVYLKKGMA